MKISIIFYAYEKIKRECCVKKGSEETKGYAFNNNITFNII
jgi:hypothetical protein